MAWYRTETTVSVNIRPLGEPGDLGWVVMAHGEVYAREFGWDVDFERLVAQIVADYAAGHDPQRERAWIAELDGRRAGCVLCVDAGGNVAKLRVLLVALDARGHGLGGRLVDACVAFAREAGYERLTLWTTASLDAARAIYLSRGFELCGEEPPHRQFGIEFVDQTYELALLPRPVTDGS
jgi:GNAT superfamily N-acetyltransferase